MLYTEEDLRKAFRAGLEKGSHRSYFDAPLKENGSTEDEKIPVTFAILNSKVDWGVQQTK